MFVSEKSLDSEKLWRVSEKTSALTYYLRAVVWPVSTLASVYLVIRESRIPEARFSFL